MGQFYNISGTTSKTFRIGKYGTTLTSCSNTQTPYLQSDTALMTTKVFLDATGNTYIDSSDYTGNANTANKLKNAINFEITGGATAAAVTTTLSQNVTLSVTSLDATKLSGNIPWAAISSLAGTSGSESKFARSDHDHNGTYAPVNANLNLIGDVTGSGAINGDITLTISTGAVTNDKVASITPSKIVLNGTDSVIGSSTNIINLYGKAGTAETADYANNLKSTADHAIVLQTNNLTSFLGAGTNGQILKTNGAGSDPSWVNPDTLTVSHAATAAALTTNAGSATLPVYFSNGVPVATSTTIGVSITGNAATATTANNAKNIINADGTKSYSYTEVNDIITNGAKSVQVGTRGTTYSSSSNNIVIPAYTEGATKTESSTTNGKIKINGVDTTVYDDSGVIASISANASTISSVSSNLSSHTTATNNPHSVTKAQVGLGSVVNAAQTSAGTDIANASTAANNTTAGLYTRALDVKTYVENKLSNDLTLGGNVTVNGNLNVKGSTITLDAQNLSISDQLLELYKRDSGTTALSGYAGIYINNYNGQNNNKIEGLFLDDSVNAYVGTATISGNTLSNASVKKLATETYVSSQIKNVTDMDILNIDFDEEATASTLVKRTSTGLVKANTPTSSSDAKSVINLDYLGKIDKNIVPSTNKGINIGSSTNNIGDAYFDKIYITSNITGGSAYFQNVKSNGNYTFQSASLRGSVGTSEIPATAVYGDTIYENGASLSTIYQPKGSYLTSADIANKLDKSTTASRIYGTDASGNQTLYSFTNNNTANTLVYRDASGNFNAGTITANLNGNASTATKASQDGQGNTISTTYYKKTGGILANVSTASANKNFSIQSYTFSGNTNDIIDYVATSTGNSVHIGGNSANTDDYGVQKIEFTVADSQETTTKAAIVTLTKNTVTYAENARIAVGANVNIGSSDALVNSIYASNIYLGTSSLSDFYHGLTNDTGSSVPTATHGTTEVITGITASNGTLTYTKAKLPSEANNRVQQLVTTSNSSYSLLFTSATADFDQGLVRFNNGITANPATGTITASIFTGSLTGTADLAKGIYVDSSTTVSAATIAKLNSATSDKTANTLVYRNANNAFAVETLYVNRIEATNTSSNLTIGGKADTAGVADLAQAVYNNTSTNTLNFNTSATYHASNGYVLTQEGSTVKHATIKDLVDDISVAYQNGTYANMSVGTATTASSAGSATKAGAVAYTAAGTNTTYYLGAVTATTAGDYTPIATGVAIKGSTITATLSGNASTATTATHIAGGSAYQIPYQTSTGTTGFITYPANISGSYILTADKDNHISWVSNPYVRLDGTLTMTGGLQLKASPASASGNNVDTYTYTRTEGGMDANSGVVKNIGALYFEKASGYSNAINFYKDDNNFSSLYADGGKLYFVGTRPLKQAGTPVEVLTAGSVTSSTVVTNLNASYLEGHAASYFATSTHNHDSSYVKLTDNRTVTLNTWVSDTEKHPFTVQRNNNEKVEHWVDDNTYHIDYTNDEAANNISFKFTNTDTENKPNEADRSPNTSYVTISASASGTAITANKFIKSGSSNQKVLLGDGTDKNISDFATSTHTHGNITNDGKLSTASQVVVTDADKKITSVAKGTAFNVNFGTGNGDAARGDHNHDSAYVHKTNSAATLSQFSGAPSYLLGIESFADGGEVKWQSTSNISVGSASSAGKVANKLLFKGTDNTEIASYDGSSSVTINKATLTSILGYEPSEVESALEFKGTLNPTSNKITLPTVSSTNNGDVWIIGGSAALVNNGNSTLNTAYSSANVEAGDMIIGFKSGASGSEVVNWTVIQKNIDGAVTGPASSTDNAIARFDGTTGKVIQNSTATIDDNGTFHIKGKMILDPSYDTAANSYNEGIRINLASNGWSELYLGGTKDSTSGQTNAWVLGRRGSNGSVSGVTGDLTIEYGGSQGNGLTLPTASTGNPSWKGNAIWHAGNDGDGSGLDADTLDGNHASAFATSTHDHAGVYEPAFTKNTAFNKNFGTGNTNVARGDHNHDGSYIKTSGTKSDHTDAVTGPIWFKDSDGIKINSHDLDVKVWEVDGNSGSYASQYGFDLLYKGTGYGNDTTLSLYAHNQTGTHVQVNSITQDGKVTNKTQNTFNEPIVIDKANGTAPFTITSSTKVTNLNVNYLDGHDASYFEPAITKNTAFNKNFGTTAGTVAEGNHTHDSRYYTESEVDTLLGAKINVAPTAIASSTDINTLTTTGFYGTAANSVIATLTNLPSGMTSGEIELQVYQAKKDNAAYITQRLTNSASKKTYIRYKNASGWSDWETIYTSVNKPSASDLGVVPTTRKVAGIDLADDITTSELVTALNGTTATTLALGNHNHDSSYFKNYSWTANITCATWSRLCYVPYEMAVSGSSYIITLQATRGNVVYNRTFAVNSSHTGGYSRITQLNSTAYSDIDVRIINDSNGNSYFEIKDSAYDATSSTTQGVKCTLLALHTGTPTLYTSFTSGASLPSGYTVGCTFTSKSGGVMMASGFYKLDGTSVSYAGHTHTKSQITDFAHDHDTVYMKISDYTAIGKNEVDTLWAEVFTS